MGLKGIFRPSYHLRIFLTLLGVLGSSWVGMVAQTLTPRWDLADWDHQEVLTLDRNWLFSPEATDRLSDFDPDNLVDLPHTWHGQIQGGDTIRPLGCHSYGIKLTHIPKRPLFLEIPAQYIVSEAYIDGVLVGRSGKADPSSALSYAKSQPFLVPIPQGRDSIELVVKIANHWHGTGGFGSAPTLGIAQKMLVNWNIRTFTAGSLAVLLFILGVMAAGLQILWKAERGLTFFSMFCVLMAFRQLRIENNLMDTFLPEIPWEFGFSMEYISLYLSAAAFAAFTYRIFPQEFSPYVYKAFKWITGFFVMTVLLLPMRYFTLLLNYFLLCVMIGLAYEIYVYFLAVKRKRVSSYPALTSSLGLLIGASYSILVQLGVLTLNPFIPFLSYLWFFFFQAMVFCYQFVHVNRTHAAKAEASSAAKTQFLSMMSHEIRTPLNAINGIVHLMDGKCPTKQQAEMLSTLKISAENLMVLTNDILDFGKIEKGKVAFEKIPLDIQAVCKSLFVGLEPEANRKNLSLSLLIDHDVPTALVGDPTRISQVLRNLLTNAVKFTEQGSVKLEISVVERLEKSVTLRISVQDTGIGIPAEKQQEIFDLFEQANSTTTRKYGGTGIGLAITKGLLKQQGIDIQLESEVGIGSNFFFEQTFELGKAPTPAPKTDQANIPSPASLQLPLDGYKILLAEDNRINIMIASKFLKKWGAEVIVAENGLEAVEQVQAQSVDLILMDLQMPEMDGFEATQEIRVLHPKLPVIALTASNLLDVRESYEKVQMNDFVPKPFRPQELLLKIRRNLEPPLTEPEISA
ncbi:response regulator [Pontibacter sp. G13]|uniref:response regulator n=1 Tax=Pontibacter sp. G13 TaxID=3074898 RepID=UPI00288C2512|nr:response regulator [Pontibacter sp. G13]WNJ17027.1 response regulator [Pontibacter sp. G13]